jgi:hypothetical protein
MASNDDHFLAKDVRQAIGAKVDSTRLYVVNVTRELDPIVPEGFAAIRLESQVA